jgi:ketosteroid isomerase-like protein
MTLYEPEAHFVNKSGETLVGRDAVRKVVGGLIEAERIFKARVVRAMTLGDIAQLYTDFEGTRVDESGKTVPVHNNAIEVLRRQSDGSWKVIMGAMRFLCRKGSTRWNGRRGDSSTRWQLILISVEAAVSAATH